MLFLKRTRSSAPVSRSCRTRSLEPEGLAGHEEGRDASEGGQLEEPELSHRGRPAARQRQNIDDQQQEDQAVQIDQILEDPRKVEVPEREDPEAQGQHQRRGAKPAMEKVPGLVCQLRAAALDNPPVRSKAIGKGVRRRPPAAARVVSVGVGLVHWPLDREIPWLEHPGNLL